MDLTAVARPMQIEAGVARDLVDRKRGAARREIDRTAGPGKRRDEGMPAFGEGDPFAVRRRHDRRGVFRAEMHDFVAAGPRHAGEDESVVAPIAKVDTSA